MDGRMYSCHNVATLDLQIREICQKKPTYVTWAASIIPRVHKTLSKTKAMLP